MFKDKSTNMYMYPILGYDNYSIDRNGRVARSHRVAGNSDLYQDYTTVVPYMNGGTPWVKLYDGKGNAQRFPVARLNIASIYGDLPFDIKFLDGYRTNVRQENLEYKYEGFEIYNDKVIKNKLYPGTVLVLYDLKIQSFAIFRPIATNILYHDLQYWISDNGAIFNSNTGRLIPRSNDARGYYKVSLREYEHKDENGQFIETHQVYIKTHQLVYTAWKDSDITGYTIDHVDGRRHNNHISNLEKVSLAENVRRAHDRNVNNNNVARAKWTIADVKKICDLMEKRTPYMDICQAFGRNPKDSNDLEYKEIANLCCAIRDGRVFKDISKHYDIPSNKEKYLEGPKIQLGRTTKEEIIDICNRLMNNESTTSIARLYNMGSANVTNIARGKVHTGITYQVPGMKEFIERRIAK